MKKHIYIFSLIFISFLTCSAQETLIMLEQQNNIPVSASDNSILYYKDINNTLNKYLGVWVFDDGVKYLKITVIKETHAPKGVDNLYNDDDFEDKLVVKLVYKVNGIEKYNTNGGIAGNTIISPNEIRLNYKEPSLINCSRQKKGVVKFEYLNTSNETIIWDRTNILTKKFNKCSDGTYYDDSDFIIPDNLILEKQ